MRLPCDKVELTDSSTWASIANDLPPEFVTPKPRETISVLCYGI